MILSILKQALGDPRVRSALRDRMPTTGAELASFMLLTSRGRVRDTRSMATALTKLFGRDGHLPESVRERFFTSTLPFMACCVNAFENQFSGVEDNLELRTKSCCTTKLRQSQALVLICCSFFCLLPAHRKDYPHANMQALFSASVRREQEKQKLLCILHYVDRMSARDLDLDRPSGRWLEYNRLYSGKVGDNSDLWRQVGGCQNLKSCSDETKEIVPLCRNLVHTGGTIEDADPALKKVVFANKYVGGGVLGRGCLQEEICFALYPECIVAVLLCPVMGDHDAAVVRGAERISRHTGYAKSFKFEGPYQDTARVLTTTRGGVRYDILCTTIIAMDAARCDHDPSRADQFAHARMVRELVKAYTGLGYRPPTYSSDGVATGNWGCGVYGGNVGLKAMLQWLAVSCLPGKQTLHYYTFGGVDGEALASIVALMTAARVTPAQLWTWLHEYTKPRRHVAIEYSAIELFDFIRERIERRLA